MGLVDVKFIRFEPRNDFKKELMFQSERLLAKCPSDATAHVKAMFEGGNFVIEFVVLSSQGRFRSSVAVPIPRKGNRDRLWQAGAVEEIIWQLHRQVRKWREKRFQAKSSVKAAA